MNLYEINTMIENLIDKETGEVADYEEFVSLQIAKDEKIENTALYIKNLLSDAEQIKIERDKLYQREKAYKNRAENLKKYLSMFLDGEKYRSPRVVCSYHKSTSTEVDEQFIEWAKENAKNYLKFKEPDVDKTAVKKAIQEGKEVPFARLVEKQNLQIK